MNTIKFAITAAILGLTLTVVKADSLYPINITNVGGATPSLFTDNRAHRVGDVLTVVVSENASGSSTAATKNSKTDSGNVGPGVGSILNLVKQFGISGTYSNDGSGSTSRSDTLSATIAVTVSEVYPNGTMKIEGTRKVGNNAEIQTMTFTGIVRQQDVAPDNSVQSPLVADAQISYAGKGPVSDPQKPGIITKIFRFVF